MLHIYVDADACPVKPEVYKVALRYRLEVTLVANSRMQFPNQRGVALQVVEGDLDAADDWIAGHAKADDIVITADILLAGRCVGNGVRVLGPTGKLFTDDNVGEAIATRDLLAELRSAGELTGGPPPLTQRDRSRFLQKLDEIIQALRREKGKA